jgi:hypothetical protein
MRRLLFSLLLIVLTAGALAGCGAGGAGGPANAVQSYLQALTSKDANKLSNLSCKSWESQATMELDSFQAVAT